ncbi:unnamed protein product [Rhizoctonia solani]|uniref:F-box domain-containing protein n=1 Tax=Rhizoctonia solani TaxID=456999 RepID=A0A8H3DPT3_9AGAM|nr:unnamed protein product [Rhizoctonia solani]
MAELAVPSDSSGYFSTLPNELIIRVLHFCSYTEILRFAATGKRYCKIVANSVSLQLHNELEANGLEIIKGSQKENATYSLLLDELVRYRDAWLNLTFEEPIERTSIKRNQTLQWELHEGSYVVAFSATPSASLGPDTLWVMSLDHLDVPSPVALQTYFHEFVTNLEQDLAVLARVDPDESVLFFHSFTPHTNNPNTSHSCFEIRFCSATTGLGHPLAHNHIWIIRVDFSIPDPEEESDVFTLDIMDNILVARISNLTSEKCEILVWDWKSGAFLLRIGSTSSIADFSFFDKTHLAVFAVDKTGPNLHSIILSLYYMTPCTRDEVPPDSCFCSSKYACARPIMTLQFPELEHFYRVEPSDFSLKSDPTPGRVVYTKSAGFARPTALTFIATLSLFKMSDTRMFDVDPHVKLQIFIDSGPLLRYLFEFAGEEDDAVIPWETWGIHATRWFLCDREAYDSLWTHGSRFVRVRSGEDSASMLHNLSVFDFHPPTVRRHGPCESEHSPATDLTAKNEETLRNLVLKGSGLDVAHILRPESNTTADANTPQLLIKTIYSSMPTVIMKGFSSPVESRLPYRVVTRTKFVTGCEEWVIDGNHVIGMSPLHRSDILDRLLVYKLQT